MMGVIIFGVFSAAFAIGLLAFIPMVAVITALAVAAGFIFLSFYVAKAVIGVFETIT